MASAAGGLALLQHAHLRLRGFFFTWWVRLWGGQVGKRLLLDKHVRLRHAPSSGWHFGDDVYIGCGAVLDVWHGAELRVGSRVKIMHHVVVGASSSISIGDDSQIAEACSLRDADHGIDGDELMVRSEVVTAPVRIGSDVWIARGSAVLRGSVIEDGAVVAANSVVRGHVGARSIVAGAPAVHKRNRGDRSAPVHG